VSEIYHRIYLIMIFAIMVNVPLSIAVGQGGNRHMTEHRPWSYYVIYYSGRGVVNFFYDDHILIQRRVLGYFLGSHGILRSYHVSTVRYQMYQQVPAVQEWIIRLIIHQGAAFVLVATIVVTLVCGKISWDKMLVFKKPV
jgi:hypothetical protein